MRLIHCADLHLDSAMGTHLPQEKAKERKNELLSTFRRMVDDAAGRRVDAILIAGDLYDTRRVSATARNAVTDAIRSHPEIGFYYLRGNHDAENFLGRMENAPENLHLFGEQWTSYVLDPKEGGRVILTGAELTGENGAGLYASLELDPGKFNLVMLHGQDTPYGSKKDAEAVDLRELANRGIDYLALGHLHAYREARLDGRGIYCYPGCLEGRGFDECGEHGYVLLEIDGERMTFRHEFVPFARRRLYEVAADVSGCRTTGEMAARVREALGRAGHSPDDLIKVVLTGEVDVECEKEPDLLAREFEDRYYVLKVEDRSRLRLDYGRFEGDRSLKGEFVRTVMADGSLSEEDKAEVIRCGIQALLGEEVR